MAITNPFSITYGDGSTVGTKVGGDIAKYQLLGPYVIDRSADTLRLVFDVVVVADSYSNLKSYSDSLETAFTAKEKDLIISIDGNNWTYTAGTHLGNVRSSIAKSGNPETDRGFSRAYTCTVSADNITENAGTGGLREFEVNVDYESSRQRIVTLRGSYTKQGDVSASAQYIANFGFGGGSGQAQTILSGMSGSATWELVDENFTRDTNDITCTFHQQYVELLTKQASSKDDDDIRDHRLVFTDLSQHPGDGAEDVHRLRRVIGTYDCAVDIEEYTDSLRSLYDDKISIRLTAAFEENFTPAVFCIEDLRISYDESSRRISAQVQFLYQFYESKDIVEVSQSVTLREHRTIDYTPVHKHDDELATYADVGFATVERVWQRTVIALGKDRPRLRCVETPKAAGPIGLFTDTIGHHLGPDNDLRGGKVVKDGWNVVSSTSQQSNQWMGNPDEPEAPQIEMSVLNETIVERYNRDPGKQGTRPIIQR